MKLLAVESSGRVASVAITSDGTLLQEVVLSGNGPRHAQSLIAETNTLLRELNFSPQQIDIVAVSHGPGSFTGLRVGLVFAKTFAWLNGASLVAVNTLHAIAQRSLPSAGKITAVIDAQRDELFVGDFLKEDSVEITRPMGTTRVVPFCDLTADGLLSGPGLSRLQERLPEARATVDPSLWDPKASAVAEIGASMAAAGEFSDVDSLEPLYIRRSYAEEKRPSANKQQTS